MDCNDGFLYVRMGAVPGVGLSNNRGERIIELPTGGGSMDEELVTPMMLSCHIMISAEMIKIKVL